MYVRVHEHGTMPHGNVQSLALFIMSLYVSWCVCVCVRARACVCGYPGRVRAGILRPPEGKRRLQDDDGCDGYGLRAVHGRNNHPL